ncbi:TonB-dependent receptor [Bacteroides mediterraneensis]|uniref:TonB-dependent receptor n=1 Tax=Bacteroides mediterraneensis TaxID=1841856 RepID=A0ABS2EUQ8_9BACE|nr:TonB-dependent receptor [Bacteroides mediterraneensis]MBM6758372.1 TonB-dependent receptor [Bacteroides mediterraneensis]
MGALVFRALMLTALYCKVSHVWAQQDKLTVQSAIEKLREKYAVMFVYNASLDLNIGYEGADLTGKNLQESLQMVFSGTDIKYEVRDGYVLLQKIKQYTLNGYVYQETGEAVVQGTVLDVNTGKGTLTDESGFFSLVLCEGRHKIRVSYIGTEEEVRDIDLKSDRMETVFLKSGYKLEEVVVTVDAHSSFHTLRDGKESVQAKDLERGVYFMSTPDVVSTLHSLSGVSSGADPASGMYVHGGDHDENQIMIDGAPLYHVNHIGGLFSAFNTDVIEQVDFYKGGFPTRYGGRLSSVLEARTREGNLQEFHGKFALGAMDARIQLEGPIVKRKTSFNVAFRRTLLNLVPVPLLDVISMKQEGNQKRKYFFHDLTACVSHVFSEKNRLRVGLYSGYDKARMNHWQTYDEGMRQETDRFVVGWGNTALSVGWESVCSSSLSMNLTGFYTHNFAEFHYQGQVQVGDRNVEQQRMEETRYNSSTIDDVGYRLELVYRPASGHRLHLGSNYTNHLLRPQDYVRSSLVDDNHWTPESRQTETEMSFHGNELSLFAEDEMTWGEKMKLNVGVAWNLFGAGRLTQSSIEPRVSFNYRLNSMASLKVSVTKMSQAMQRLSSTYLNMPIDCWVFSTDKTGYSYSWQLTAGFYKACSDYVHLRVGGFYKTMNHLIEYNGMERLTPSAVAWEENISKGKGISYGAECEAAYDKGPVSLHVSYTLAWSKRFFPDFYDGWFLDKFDNRHTLNASLNCSLGKKVDFYALWRFHSGNRFTLPQQIVSAPLMPDEEIAPADFLLYDVPNNAALPAYHRLDCGVRYRKPMKKGREQIWDVSIYNMYARHNAFYAEQVLNPDGTVGWKTVGGLPFFPSLCYTIKF